MLLDGRVREVLHGARRPGRRIERHDIEGLADGDGTMHPVQRAFHEHHGLQCGYCTPGMVMATVVAPRRARRPSSPNSDIRVGLEGNLCRCTGYHNIVKAAMAAARAPELRS